MTKAARALLFVVGPAIGLWLGCNSILGTQPGLPEGSGGSGGGTESATSTTASASAGTTTGTGASTSTSTSSGGTDGGAPCDSGKPCDCDDDGYNAATAECNHDGGDCDDDDPLVHPGQSSWFTTKSIHGLWDYNCDGMVELEYTAVLSCGNGLGCDTTTKAWSSKAAVPSCGVPGSYGTCVQMAGLSCTESIAGARTQGCH